MKIYLFLVALSLSSCNEQQSSDHTLKALASSEEREMVSILIRDAHVKNNYPNSNYDQDDHLRARKTSSEEIRIYLQFSVTSTSNISQAVARLYAKDGSPDGGSIYLVDSSWPEPKITWNNSPSFNGYSIDTIGAINTGEVAEFDVSSVVKSSGTYTFVIKSENSNSVIYHSGEVAAKKPSLMIKSSGLPSEPTKVTESTEPAEPSEPPNPGTPIPTVGIWSSKTELASFPTSGSAWQSIISYASKISKHGNTPDFADQNDDADIICMANAIAYARTGNRVYADKTIQMIEALITANPVDESLQWDWLGALRGLGAYPISADLVGLASLAPSLDKQFRTWLDRARFAKTEGGRGSVVDAHENRPNNFGSHGAASRIAAALYLGDKADLEKAVLVFKGQLGDRKAYASFKFGDLVWQANRSSPVQINPKGSVISINGVLQDVDGMQPEEQRRCSTKLVWPLCDNLTYLWEGLQGLVVAAEMLHRAGYPAFEWSDQAIFRAVSYLYKPYYTNGTHPAGADDQWILRIINKRYKKDFPLSSNVAPGKMVGYTDFTHQ